MPVSRQRKKKTSFNLSLSKSDVRRKEEAYYKKLQEFDSYELEQLNTILESKTAKGVHLSALIVAINIKKQVNNKLQNYDGTTDSLKSATGEVVEGGQV